MDNERLLGVIQQLLGAVRREAEFYTPGAPAWVTDQSLDAIVVLAEMEQAARANTLMIGPGFTFRDRLGADYVDVCDFSDLVHSIDCELHRSDA